VSAVTSAVPTVETILTDNAATSWIRLALESALTRDPVDALNDALALAAALETHLRLTLGIDEDT
jgi:hypothetical protein